MKISKDSAKTAAGICLGGLGIAFISFVVIPLGVLLAVIFAAGAAGGTTSEELTQEETIAIVQEHQEELTAYMEAGELAFTESGNEFRLEPICGRFYFYYEAY